MTVRSAFHKDKQGYYAYQDPDDDLDWIFDFRDDDEPALLPSESIAVVTELILSRDDGVALDTEEQHDQSNDADEVVVWITKLKKNVTYRLECTVQTNASPLREYSRSFRIICKEQ